MAASAKKKNKKGKTISLTDFLAEDGGTGGGSTYVPTPVSWADETDDLEGDVSTSWHSNDDDVYRAPPIDRSILPTAPRAAREPNIDQSRLPKSPPCSAFLGNLPYDVTEDSIKEFFRGLNISATALMTTRLEGVMIALETSIKIVTIQTDTVKGIGTVIVMAHAGTWIDTGGRDRYDDRGGRDYDRGYDSRIGSGRRAFGSRYRRDDDYGGGGDR
ncbi:unnamed protein product [Rangifer tarandus platyrhynchus]|uniref:RRM domain-containing protein n=1 Tax=Rangifer tarandus platyrhynchus TaxID=3082113 RepID=A0ABN8YB51_RANTA|nr:unnamed protein product [Rangifer tarandus platyrhynchus]